MKKFLSKLIRVRLINYGWETDKYIYDFPVVNIIIDLYVIDFQLSFAYWLNIKSIAEKEREFDERLAQIFREFELTEAYAPAPKKKATKKPAAKKKSAKKTTTKK